MSTEDRKENTSNPVQDLEIEMQSRDDRTPLLCVEGRLNFKDWAPGILCDSQIATHAYANKMITPFHGKKVSGPGIISYGLSSYSYDAVLANEFKVLKQDDPTRVIDTKNPDPSLWEDIVADELIIPPHGFVLARTEEYFKIPKDILACCLTKSSHARCFPGDQTILLSNNTQVAFKDLGQYFKDNPTVMGLSYNDQGNFVAAPLKAPRMYPKEQLWIITLSDDSVIYVTPDHEFLTLDPSSGNVVLVEAQNLVPTSQLIQFSYNTSVKLEVKMVGPSPNNIQDVYCVSAPDFDNYLLGNGICVHNCALIVNPTPLHPGWEGYVTLEISNTTPNPVKIYAHEGICQFLFFKGSQKCAKPYPENGKYQRQQEVVLAKTGE